jgi:hypothetical protein
MVRRAKQIGEAEIDASREPRFPVTRSFRQPAPRDPHVSIFSYSLRRRSAEGFCRTPAPGERPRDMERYAGLEPALSVWKTEVLPLHQYRLCACRLDCHTRTGLSAHHYFRSYPQTSDLFLPLPSSFQRPLSFWLRCCAHSQIVRALPDLWRFQKGSNLRQPD